LTVGTVLVLAACHRDSAARARATPVPSGSGARVVVAAGGDLQAALDRAQPGDELVLQAGATFRGPFTLPPRAGDGWVTVRSSATDEVLPPGRRIGPGQAHLLPKLESSEGSVVSAASGARRYRLVGLEIRPAAGQALLNLVTLGLDESSVDALPDEIVIERCYLHGDPAKGTRRGIALNSRRTTIVDSYLSDFKEVGADAQAIAGWNGPGPYRIENNTLEGAGENILFGGADPSISGLVPADITIRGNLMRKPLSWKQGEPEYAGTPWTVKNVLELKNARRVLIEGNRLENNWVQSQNGFAVLFTVRNQDGRAPWSTVEEVTFRGNVVRHTASAINILARDDNWPSGQARSISIVDNLFEDVGSERWGGGGRLIQILDGAADVVVEHNTALHTGNILTVAGRPNPGFVFRNNIAVNNDYGIIGDGTGPGTPTVAAYFPRATFRRNVLVGAEPGSYPADNFFPSALAQVGFVGGSPLSYRLSAASPYRGAATDGLDVGVDEAAIAGAGSVGPSAKTP
jgi:hypothetical protein